MLSSAKNKPRQTVQLGYILPNFDRTSEYDRKNLQNVFEACDVYNPVSAVLK